MNILITESQTKILLSEGVSDVLKEIYSDTIDYSADLYKRVVKRLGLNSRILLTFSAMIGGLARPLEEYLAGKFTHLNEEEIILLVIGVVSILWNENRQMIREILGRIKELDIEDEFKDGFKKAKKLQSSFRRFLASTVKGTSFITDVISYTYMIPLLGYLVMALKGQDFSPEQIDMLVKRLSIIGVFTVSTEVLESIIRKMLGKS